MKINWTGATIGSIAGLLLTRQPFGLLLGGLVGGFLTPANPFAPRPVDHRRARLLEPWFFLAGALAKADGRVSDAEVAAAERWMQRLALDGKSRSAAIDAFNEGKNGQGDWRKFAQELAAHCLTRLDLKLMVLGSLQQIGSADGRISDARLFAAVREELAVSAELWDSMAGQFDQRSPNRPKLAEAYAALGVDSAASDDVVRKAYRRAISRFHPDKLVADNAGAEQVAASEARAREINIAYDVIRDARGMT